MINATPQQLRRAADLAEQIQALQRELDQVLAGEVHTPAASVERPRKNKMSDAGRAAISAAAKARWAKRRAAKGEGKGTKRSMSAAAKAKLSAIAKARWKKAKQSGQKTLSE
jgi:hypothetical protein